MSLYLASPHTGLKVGGGQGDAAAARASCLSRVTEIFVVFPLKVVQCSQRLCLERPPANWEDWFPWDIGL